MIVAMLLAAAVVYGPPTNNDVLDAYSANIVANLREAGDVFAEERVRQFGDFPATTIVERCRKKAEHRILGDAYQPTLLIGYECIFEVWPNTETPFRTSGFFRFTGFDWEFFGPERAMRVPSVSDFARSEEAGEFILKPGALDYNGDPNNPLNENYDPYQALFKATERR